MSYPWNNTKKLDKLQIDGENDILIYETEHEKAKVYIQDGDIAKVECYIGNNKIVIDKNQIHHIIVGKGNIERDVYHYLKPNGITPYLRLGITKHKGDGTWSSLPHPFELNPELGFEEVFFYLLKSKNKDKRALQIGKGVWYDGSHVDNVWFVSDHSWCTIPMGYHPVVAEPGVHVSYVWAYLAKKKEWEKI